jgi:hypothetical protein
MNVGLRSPGWIGVSPVIAERKGARFAFGRHLFFGTLVYLRLSCRVPVSPSAAVPGASMCNQRACFPQGELATPGTHGFLHKIARSRVGCQRGCLEGMVN